MRPQGGMRRFSAATGDSIFSFWNWASAEYAGDHQISLLEHDSSDPKATYARINLSEAYCPQEIQKQAICIDGDIGNVLHALLQSVK